MAHSRSTVKPGQDIGRTYFGADSAGNGDMRRIVIACVVVAAACTAIAGRGAGPVEPARAQSQVVVSMQNDQYNPNTITIAAGTTVVWENDEDPNASNVTHDVVSDDGSWYSDFIDPGQTFAMTFTTPGTYSYFCDLHANMEGTIVVQ